LSGQGVPQTTLEYLLAPYLDVAQLPALLNRLVQARFLLFNETTRTYTLHPYDRVHALAQIPQSADEWSYGALNERMADFYARQRVSEPQSLADLEPQLHEFEHRLANHDYDTAAQLLVQIDFKFLLLWGYVELMLTLHTRLEGKISNPGLAGISAGNLGMAYRNMGQVEKAIGYYEKALAMARQQNHRQGEGTWLGNLGIAYSDLGQVEKAIAYYLQAIEIARDSKDRRGEGGWFGNLGNAYYQLGKVEKAIITYLQALEIAREMKDRRGEGVCISNLGNAYLNLGEFEKAIEYYLQALENTRESKNRSGECTRLGNLGEAYTALKQYDRAIPLIQQAVAIAEEIKSPTNSQYKNMQLAKSYLYSGDVAQALTTIRKARTYDVPENNHAVALLQGVVALHAGERQEAQDAFADSLRLADELLAKTPNLYEALYDRALAHVGVLACGGSDDHLASARADVAKARAIFAGAGILNDKKRLLEALCQAAGQIWEIGL
jgi:tetratricopeptide (TPR) repeat protein